VKDLNNHFIVTTEGNLDPKDILYTFYDFKGLNRETRPFSLVAKTDDRIKIWHEILWHINVKHMNLMVWLNIFHGLPIVSPKKADVRVMLLVNITKKHLRMGRHGGKINSWSL
jgi:hypothetical protein